MVTRNCIVFDENQAPMELVIAITSFIYDSVYEFQNVFGISTKFPYFGCISKSSKIHSLQLELKKQERMVARNYIELDENQRNSYLPITT